VTQHNDLDGRNANEAIKQIAIDLLEGKHIEITYSNGRGRHIQGVLIRAAPQEFPDLPFTAQLEFYDLQQNELLGGQTIIRSDDKTYWRGYE